MVKHYEVKITNCNKELSPKEKVMLKDTSDAKSLGDIKEGESITIKPVTYAELHIIDDKSENGEYDVFVIIDNDGNKYTTASEYFMYTFLNIMGDMEDCNEDYGIKIYTKPSKNYKGKSFLTCSVV